MKIKLQIASLMLLVGMLIAATMGGNQKVFASNGQSELFAGSEAMFITPIRSTYVKVYDGPCTVYRIDLSSGLVSTDYAQIVDTWMAVGTSYVALTTSSKVSVPIMYQVNPSSQATNQGTYKDYGPYGIRITTGLAIFKTAAESGEAITATVYWRR